MDAILDTLYPGQVVPLRYHVWWPNGADEAYNQNPLDVQDRVSEYGVGYAPSFRMNGDYIADPSDAQFITLADWYSWFRSAMDSLFAVPAPLSIEIQQTRTDDSIYVAIDVEADAVIERQPVLFLTIAETWTRLGLPAKHHYVFRDVFPNTGGLTLSLANPGDMQHVEFVVPIDPAWHKGRLMAIVHVRDATTLEVHNVEVGEVPLYSVDVPSGQAPLRVVLDQNVPNPFNPTTTIGYRIDQTADVRLSVYSAAGRLVSRLVDGPVGGGFHEVSWDGTDLSGGAVGSGIYYYRLTTGDTDLRNKMVLIR